MRQLNYMRLVGDKQQAIWHVFELKIYGTAAITCITLAPALWDAL